MTALLSRTLNWGFRRYVRRFVRKNFNAVRAQGIENLSSLARKPVICFLNHPGWWDPMTGVLMTDLLFSERRFVAPMDAHALRRYPILERLGFFPVERDTTRGAREFLRHSRQLLSASDAILWVTPSGKFHDVRQPASFMAGLTHVVHQEFEGWALPMAVEYTFWNERSPELLVRFGKPLSAVDLPSDREARTLWLERSLAETQADLAAASIARDAKLFTTLLTGRAGVGGLYDLWRRLSATVRRERFSKRHSNDSTLPMEPREGEPA